jgi:hypothetical protein
MAQTSSYQQSFDKTDFATEVISSTIHILKAAGFSDSEIQELFAQAVRRGVRAPFWAEPL